MLYNAFPPWQLRCLPLKAIVARYRHRASAPTKHRLSGLFSAPLLPSTSDLSRDKWRPGCAKCELQHELAPLQGRNSASESVPRIPGTPCTRFSSPAAPKVRYSGTYPTAGPLTPTSSSTATASILAALHVTSASTAALSDLNSPAQRSPQRTTRTSGLVISPTWTLRLRLKRSYDPLLDARAPGTPPPSLNRRCQASCRRPRQ